MDFEALINARHSWNHTRCFGDATCLDMLSHIPPLRGLLPASAIVMVTAQINHGGDYLSQLSSADKLKR